MLCIVEMYKWKKKNWSSFGSKEGKRKMKVRQTDWQKGRQSFSPDWKQRREERLNISDVMHYLYLRQVGWICQGALGWMAIFRCSATCVFLWVRKRECVWMCVCVCVCVIGEAVVKRQRWKRQPQGDPSVDGATLKLLLCSGRRPRWPSIACAPQMRSFYQSFTISKVVKLSTNICILALHHHRVHPSPPFFHPNTLKEWLMTQLVRN